MSNVISLQITRFSKNAQTKGFVRIETEFDASDVLRLTQDDKVLRLDDAVVFGPKAGPQIHKMLATMGQTQVPKTFAELFGAHRLGITINAIRPSLAEDVPAVVQASTLERANEEQPGLSVLLQHLRAGDLAAASEWHRETDSMAYWAAWYKSAFSGSKQGI